MEIIHPTKDLDLVDGEFQIYTELGLTAFAQLVNGEAVASDYVGYHVKGEGQTWKSAVSKYNGKNDINGALYEPINMTADGKQTSWTPIGNYSADNLDLYKGVFDGRGKDITNLYIDATKGFQGLFGYTNGATIKNVNIAGSVESKPSSGNADHIGGIVGYANATRIPNCVNECSVSLKATSSSNGCLSNGGGIAATINNSKISGCTNNGDIEFGYNAKGSGGGIVGDGKNSTITSCVNNGTVKDMNDGSSYSAEIGGICGAAADMNISRCYNSNNVTYSSSVNQSKAGGIIGSSNTSTNMSYCYNMGDISGTNYAGGLVGFVDCDDNSTFSYSYSAGVVSSTTVGAKTGGLFGIVRGTGGYSAYNSGRMINLYYDIDKAQYTANPLGDSSDAIYRFPLKSQSGHYESVTTNDLTTDTSVNVLTGLNSGGECWERVSSGSYPTLRTAN